MEPISYTDSSLNSPLNFDLQIRFDVQWQRTTVCWMVVMIFERAGQVKTLPLLLKGWNQSGPKVFRRVLQPSARSVCGNALTFWKQKIFLLWNVFVWRQCAQLHRISCPRTHSLAPQWHLVESMVESNWRAIENLWWNLLQYPLYKRVAK